MAAAWQLAWEKTSKMPCNERADFMTWVVSGGLRHEPFVPVDLGAQVGEKSALATAGDRLLMRADPAEP
jgi:hypothetical protein